MSDSKISIQNDNDKDVKKDNIPEQTSLDSSFDMHAGENEEKHVRRSVLHTEEEHKAGRGESKIDLTKGSNKNFNTYEKEYTVGYNQPPPGQGQGWYSQGPPQGQGQGWFPQGPPQGQGQGWFPQGPPQGQGQGWFSQGPPQGQDQGQQQQNRGFGRIHARHADYHSGPALDYSPEKEDRNAFVRKVLSILLVMLLITSAVMTAVLMIPPAKLFFREYWTYITLPSLLILMGMSYVMPVATCARKSPTNYVCLFIVLVLETLVCCGLTARIDTMIILQAFLATLGCVLVCVILACTKFDFTKWLLIVFVVMVALVVLSVIVTVTTVVFKIELKAVRIAILVGFTIVNVVMLTIELQMILGGKSVEISEEDYALGAYMLYTTIIHLFITLVQLLGSTRINDND